MTQERAVQIVHAILEESFWLPTLKPAFNYVRFEDDSRKGNIAVMFGEDGDGYINVTSERDPDDPHFSMRFRMPMVGGGQSPRVRTALLILAEAIRLDNEERPQHRG
jgi:hypothetical protein